jgi:hypothetical protein
MNNNYDFEPLVEVLKFSEVKKGDVLILRCEAGKENEEILKMHSALKSLILEKDLRILAVNPSQSMDSIFMGIKAAQGFSENYFEEEDIAK